MKNYVRLVEGTEHVETKFFDDANREETLQVVTGLLGKAAVIGKKAMVFAWDRDSLPQSLAAQVYRIGRWVCHTCRKEAERCRCKSHAVKPRLQVVKPSEALN